MIAEPVIGIVVFVHCINEALSSFKAQRMTSEEVGPYHRNTSVHSKLFKYNGAALLGFGVLYTYR